MNTEPVTDELNAHRMPTTRYLQSEIEHTLIFQRRNGQEVDFAVDHEDVSLVVFNLEENPTQEIHLSFAEANLLRGLLNRREIVEILSQH